MHQLPKVGGLFFGQILRALQEQPASPFEHTLLVVGVEPLNLSTADLAELSVELPHDMEEVEDICACGDFLATTFRYGPHTSLQTDPCSLRVPCEGSEEAQQSAFPALRTAP